MIVMPCLNEQDTISSACVSLGFGMGSRQKYVEETVLILVDNGSNDRTKEMMFDIQKHSQPGQVLVVDEPTRGYVPARDRGNRVARELSSEIGVKPEEVLILQMDADTQYESDYVQSMRELGQTYPTDVLLEGIVRRSPRDKLRFAEYFEACEEADRELDSLFVQDAADVVVDDKVAGYRLHDYFRWGAHRREYTWAGEEIHAETTRLYLRAKGHSGQRVRCDRALAFHSARRMNRELYSQIASAGFPREESWKRQWIGANETHGKHQADLLRSALEIRRHHTIGLFCILPQHFYTSLGSCVDPDRNAAWTTELMSLLPIRTKVDALQRPGQIIGDVLTIVDKHGSLLLETARGVLGRRNQAR